MAKQSLAAQSQPQGELAPVGAFNVAETFGETGVMQVAPRLQLPYLVFAQPKAEQQFRFLMSHFPDIEDGDPVLMYPEPQKPVRIVPLKCTIVAAKQYFAQRDPSGKELAWSSTAKPGWAERILTAMILYWEGKALPCTCTFKTTKCAAAHAIVDEINKCQEPEWANKGPEYKQAATVCSTPFTRIVATITVAGKTSRKTNLSYKITKPVIAPSGPTEWQMLGALLKDNMTAFKDIADAYKARLAELNIKD